MRKMLLMMAMAITVCSVQAQLRACSPTSYIKAANPGGGDFFGNNVTMSADGLTLAVGAPFEDGNGTGVNPAANDLFNNTGAVYVYVRSSVSAAWQFQAYIKSANNRGNSQFGTSLGLSNDGNVLVVGAFGEDGSGTGVNPPFNNLATDAGAAYVYRRTGAVWGYEAYLKASNTQGGDNFGYSVAISGDGNTIVVGAYLEVGSGFGVNPTDDNSGLGNKGAAYVYTFNGSSWVFGAYLKKIDPNLAISNSDYFGNSVSVSDDGLVIAVSAINESGNGSGINPSVTGTSLNSGAVYTYRRISGIWATDAYIKASNSDVGDAFGSSISLSGDGNVLAVSAFAEDGSGSGVNPPYDNAGINNGAVYIYRHASSNWSFEAYLKAPNSSSSDSLGWVHSSLRLSKDGSTLLVGSPNEDGSGTGVDPASDELRASAGAAYMFRYAAGTWSFLHYLKTLNNTSNQDYFGYSVSLNADGSEVAIGAYLEDGNGSGVNPSVNESLLNSGAVMTYAPKPGVVSPVLPAYNSNAVANICVSDQIVYLQMPTDASGLTIIARINKNGNSFTVNSAEVNALTSGTFSSTLGAESAELMRRTLSISTTPSTGLTVNGGPIVRLYYDATELDNETGGYPVQQWIKYPGTRADMIDDLQHNGVRFSTAINPIASGVEGGVSYVDFQVTSFSVFAHLGASGTLLPVQLHSFTGHGDRHRGVIQLTWNTSSEQQSSHFEIEHSLTGTDFVQVGRVAAAGTSVTERLYGFAHATQVPGQHYYRLKQVDKDGRYVYSGVIKVQLTAGDVRGVLLYPVPAKDQVQVQLTDNKYAGQTVQLLTAQGQLLRQVLLQGNRVSIDLRGMAAGVYVLRLPDGNVQRFVKE